MTSYENRTTWYNSVLGNALIPLDSNLCDLITCVLQIS